MYRVDGLVLLILAGESAVKGEEVNVRGALHVSHESLRAVLPHDAHLLLDPASIEQFLDDLEGSPPDWATVYGHDYHDPGHDDRLFALNRARDAKREGNRARSRRITFVWLGELSPYTHGAGGFPVALGPKFISTRWGIVRFKPEEAPGNLVVVVGARQREIERRQHLEIEVVMTGRLIPEESLVYDFSHDEEGCGLIMPFVRVEQVDFRLAKQ